MNKRIRYISALLIAGMTMISIASCAGKTDDTEKTENTSAVSVSETSQITQTETQQEPESEPESQSEPETQESVSVEFHDTIKTGEEKDFIIPAIRINGVDDEPVNKEIKDFINSLDKEWFTGSEYSYYIGEGYVSLLVRAISSIDMDCYEVYNVSLPSGELMDKDEFLAFIGVGSKDFDALVSKTLEEAMNDSDGMLFESNEYMDCRADTLSPKNIELAEPFVSDRGNLCFVSLVYMSVGSGEYTICFDTTTHEHMHNNFGSWSFYPEWG